MIALGEFDSRDLAPFNQMETMMTKREALEIVLDLATENVLVENMCDNDEQLLNERKRQLEACIMVTEMIEECIQLES